MKHEGSIQAKHKSVKSWCCRLDRKHSGIWEQDFPCVMGECFNQHLVEAQRFHMILPSAPFVLQYYHWTWAERCTMLAGLNMSTSDVVSAQLNFNQDLISGKSTPSAL